MGYWNEQEVIKIRSTARAEEVVKVEEDKEEQEEDKTSGTPCAEIDKKNCAGHRSRPIYEQSSAPPPKAPRGSQGGPLQSKSFQQKHSPIDIFKRCHINANIVILLNLFVIVGWHT